MSVSPTKRGLGKTPARPEKPAASPLRFPQVYTGGGALQKFCLLEA
ncbi:MAG: hypothetical protein LBP22_05560 [Deltaproteobacteria bacterium]|nr:hypothetical protein [Deltaproteobacteria bacterium]